MLFVKMIIMIVLRGPGLVHVVLLQVLRDVLPELLVAGVLQDGVLRLGELLGRWDKLPYGCLGPPVRGPLVISLYILV